MLRFYTKFTLLLLLICVVPISAAKLIGEWQRGDVLLYTRSVYGSYDISLRIFDVHSGLSLELISISDGGTSTPQPRPDGVSFFRMCNGYITCDLWLWDGMDTFSITHNFAVGYPKWLPNGDIAFDSCGMYGCDLWLWDGQTVNQLTNTIDLNERDLVVSAEGRLAYSSCALNMCDLWIWEENEAFNLTNTRDLSENAAQWSRDGQLLSYQACDLEYLCYQAVWDGQETTRINEIPNSGATSFVWNEAGEFTYRLCANDNCDLWLWDGQTTRNITETTNFNENFLSWSGTGLLAYSMCDFNSLCELRLWDGQQSRVLTHQPFVNPTLPHWNSAGKIVIALCQPTSGDCDLWLWDGAQMVNLTNTPNLIETLPVWLP